MPTMHRTSAKGKAARGQDEFRDSRRTAVTLAPRVSVAFEWFSVDHGRTSPFGLPSIVAPDARVGERGRDYALNTKGNFCFERSIEGWRSHSVLDLRRKR
jgi:hypothetical protein